MSFFPQTVLETRHIPNLDNGERGGSAYLTLAIENLAPGTPYYWDGLRRGCNRHAPLLLFQYSLSGFGCFVSRGVECEVAPGHAIVTLLPSAHCYWLPAHSPGWRFAWFITNHSFMVHRLGLLLDPGGNSVPLGPESAVYLGSQRIFEQAVATAAFDPSRVEAALLDWTLDIERHVRHLRSPQEPREALLNRVRSFAIGNLHRSLGVEDLALQFRMSRTHFSHHFKNVTGITPADYLLSLRLQAVTDLIEQNRASLKEIAARTGFADANHLGKCFKRKFHVSPSEYRRQVENRHR